MADLEIADCINETCPWSGEPVQADSLTEYNGQVVGFCNPGCRDKFDTALRHFEKAKAPAGARQSRPVAVARAGDPGEPRASQRPREDLSWRRNVWC